MYTLILDSTYKMLSVGLAKDGKMLQKIEYEAWQRQSEYMIPEIENILKNNNVNPKEIGEIIVTLGPGSYTGIRIGLTIAKIYAYALKISCYAMSSLKVLQDLNKTSICVLNARSNRSYIGVYNKNEVILQDTIMANDDVIQFISEHPNYEICGDAEYLDVKSSNYDILDNMLSLKDESSRVENILTLKAVYLKD